MRLLVTVYGRAAVYVAHVGLPHTVTPLPHLLLPQLVILQVTHRILDFGLQLQLLRCVRCRTLRLRTVGYGLIDLIWFTFTFDLFVVYVYAHTVDLIGLRRVHVTRLGYTVYATARWTPSYAHRCGYARLVTFDWLLRPTRCC